MKEEALFKLTVTTMKKSIAGQISRITFSMNDAERDNWWINSEILGWSQIGEGVYLLRKMGDLLMWDTFSNIDKTVVKQIFII
jgi:hypothetical protein